MIERVGIREEKRLGDYARAAPLAGAVEGLVADARRVAPRLRGRRVWMVNSTARGGGVAEMLPTVVALLRDLGIQAEWAVIGSDEPAFFDLTKRLHNMIHGEGNGALGPRDRELFEAVNRRNAEAFARWVEPGDVLVVHDPQPIPLASQLEAPGARIWRCHIGLDRETPATREAWRFLAPYAEGYDRAVFSAPEYVPDFLEGRSSLIFPAIDPLTEKNRDLHVQRVVEVLSSSGLAGRPDVTMADPFPEVAERLRPDGRFTPADVTEEIGLLHRPIITQISRWDRLKGYRSLLEAFAKLKRDAAAGNGRPPAHRRAVESVRLVLAGPDPSSIQDDPEGQEVLEELRGLYVSLRPEVQRDVALVTLPMGSRSRNALMVNALQRVSTVVAQNSLREGFGLTITEAMWKRVPILSNSRAVGPRHQVRDRTDGILVGDPEDAAELSGAMDEMLADAAAREEWGASARRRVHEKFLIFHQLRAWMNLLDEVA